MDRRTREYVWGYVLISPWIIGFLCLTALPLLASFLLSFTNWNGLSSPIWVGLRNYSQILKNDPLFWKSLKITVIYTIIVVPVTVALGFILAIALNRDVAVNHALRIIYYLPQLVSGVSLLLLWLWIFNPNYGLINKFLAIFHIRGPGWLGSETWALPALMLMSLWSVGPYMLLYLAGLQRIPEEVYEAARLDGASKFQTLWHVTLPLISPITFVLLVIGFIGHFQTFGQAFVMTQGGPNYATLFYALYVYNAAFSELKLGYASALAWILFIIILATTLIQWKLSKKWVVYEEDIV
jgi:multiple sugar transport system permease protein